ncbi:MAG: DUF6789 family protein [Acidobacteriota bacterium]
MRPTIGNAFLGGFVATLVLTGIMYWLAPIMMEQPMDVAMMIGSIMGISWILGMLVHFLNGTFIFPALYAAIYPVLPGANWFRGLIWGLILWFFAQILFAPAAGMGLFTSQSPMMALAVMGSLIGHMIYGMILGGLADGVPVETRYRRERHPEHHPGHPVR